MTSDILKGKVRSQDPFPKYLLGILRALKSEPKLNQSEKPHIVDQAPTQ
jgi:hypothetical protein